MFENFTKSELFSVYNHVRAFAKRNPDLVDPARVNRALGILLSNEYYTGERRLYLPTSEMCGCKDAQYWFAAKRKYRGACKHSIAEYMIDLMILRRDSHDVTKLVQAGMPAQIGRG